MRLLYSCVEIPQDAKCSLVDCAFYGIFQRFIERTVHDFIVVGRWGVDSDYVEKRLAGQRDRDDTV